MIRKNVPYNVQGNIAEIETPIKRQGSCWSFKYLPAATRRSVAVGERGIGERLPAFNSGEAAQQLKKLRCKYSDTGY